MAEATVEQGSKSEELRSKITPEQRAVFDELRRIYIETGGWPIHIFLEEQLEERGIELDEQLRKMPPLTFLPDNSFSGGHYQDGDQIRLTIRGLVCCTDAEQEVTMFVTLLRWAVEKRRAVRQQPHKVSEVNVTATDVLTPLGPSTTTKLVLDVLSTEPVPDLPCWTGPVDGWQLMRGQGHWMLPPGIKRFKGVETIDDYLALTEPKPRTRVARRIEDPPMWPESSTSQPTPVRTGTDDHPIFGRLVRADEAFQCFVLLPLKEPFKTIYSEAVEPVASEVGISCGHAESIFGPGRIMKDIVSSITFAEVIVAELTGRNPNVFYELGIAHQQGKQVVLLAQDINDVPFDLREMRVVEYTWDGSVEAAERLRDALRPNLEAALRAVRRVN